MRSRVLIILAGVVALGVGQLAYRWMHAAAAPPVPILGDVSFPDVSGASRRISEWSGKILVVNFWATWCPPCREEMPEFSRLRSEFASRGVEFIGIAIDDPKEVKEYLVRAPVNYPILIGQSGGAQWAADLGNVLQVLPFTAVFDRDGRLVRVKAGPFDRDELVDVLSRIIGKGGTPGSG